MLYESCCGILLHKITAKLFVVWSLLKWLRKWCFNVVQSPVMTSSRFIAPGLKKKVGLTTCLHVYKLHHFTFRGCSCCQKTIRGKERDGFSSNSQNCRRFLNVHKKLRLTTYWVKRVINRISH